MYLENNFSMQAAQCTLALQQEIVERRGAEGAAQAANRTQSAFLANMSHELRSPLNAILGFSQLMNRSDDLSPEHRDNLQIIIRNGEHLLTLINQVLDLSKIEAGRTTLNENKFDLHQVDNNRDNCQLLMKLLSPLNFELQEAIAMHKKRSQYGAIGNRILYNCGLFA